MEKNVSFVIPTFNEERYLESTLKAIKTQNYAGSYEIIVSDGGSDDKTLEVAEKYASKIIKVDSEGIGVGRNAGARKATGDILVFVDADTILLPNTLTEIVHAFKDRGVMGVAVPLMPTTSHVGDILMFLSLNAFVKFNAERGKGNAKVVGACCAYRKSVFDEVGGFDEALEALEDFDLSERISEIGRIKYVEDSLALVSTRRIDEWGKIKSIKEYISLYLKHLLSEKGLKLFSIKEGSYKPIR